MTPDAIMIFAAGRGTRMGALTQHRPKPLIDVAGRALIDHALAHTAGRGLRRVVNVHHHAEQVERHLHGQDILFSDERDALLETGGGLRQALPLLGPGPVFTMNSDAVWRGPNPLGLLAEAWDPARMSALLLLVPPGAAIGHTGGGDFDRAPDGRLTRAPGAIYTGAQILQPAGLAEIEEPAFSLNRLWDIHAQSGRLYGVIYPGEWCDVGRPEGIALAEAMLENADV